MQSSDNTLSKTQTDEEIKQTFNMLMERISNVEDLLQEQRRTSQEQRRASMFAECIKYGRLNNVLLGFPYDITRRVPYYRPDERNMADPPPSMQAIVVDILLRENCTCSSPGAVEVVAGEDVAKVVSLNDNSMHPADVGWLESRFKRVEDEAIQRYIDSIFQDTSFDVKLCWDATLDDVEHFVRYHISPKKPGMDVLLLEYLKEIPKIIIAHRHTNVRCIRGIDIATDPDPNFRILETIQYAANLEDGPFKQGWITQRDSQQTFRALLALSKKRFLASIEEVWTFLNLRGYNSLDNVDEDLWNAPGFRGGTESY